MSLLRLVFAQAATECRTRLRSTGTLVAMIALLALSFLWIPDPATNAVSISWGDASGARVSSIYNSAYVGAAAAILASIFLSIAGFYLVAGSVRRDRESGVGAILAATPLPSAAYLLGKLAAHAAYLHALAAGALLSGMLVFARYGVGGFQPMAFAAPFVLLLVPSLLWTAALAVLFDVVPGLRSRGGLVLFFFAWSFLCIGASMELHRPGQLTLFDPLGLAAFSDAILAGTPGATMDSLAIGLEYLDAPIARVAWAGVPFFSATFVASRLAACVWALVPLGLAVIFFDRFDPARLRARAARRGLLARLFARPTVTSVVPTAPTAFRLTPIATHPTAWSAIVAEARLVWDGASWLRWPLLLAALAGAVTPGGTAALLLLLAPVLSEVASREDAAGTRALVFSQPGVPRSPVLWKAGAVALFLMLLGLPSALRAFVTSAAQGAALVTGLLFVCGFAVGASSLSRGGKLFAGTYTALWYLAMNGRTVGAFDYCGISGAGLSPAVRAAYVAIGLSFLALAALVERRRAIAC